MRATLATLPLASLSEVPRPTTSRQVSSRPTSLSPRSRAASIRSRAAASSLASMPRSRPISIRDAVLGGIGVEHRGHVVLHVAGGEQHAGHRQHAVDALGTQPIEALADDRPRELEIAHRDRPFRQPLGDPVDDPRELDAGGVVAAAVPADHHADAAHACPSPSVRPTVAGPGGSARRTRPTRRPRAIQNRKLVTVTATTKRWWRSSGTSVAASSGCGAPIRCGAMIRATATTAHSGDAAEDQQGETAGRREHGGDPPHLAWQQRCGRHARQFGRQSDRRRQHEHREAGQAPEQPLRAIRSPARAGRRPRSAAGRTPCR